MLVLTAQRLLCLLKGGDHVVAKCIKLRILLLESGIGQNVLNRAAQSLICADRTYESRNGPLELAVVKDDGIGLVAGERALKVVRTGCMQKIRGNAIGMKRPVQLVCDDAVNLVPRQRFVAGDVVGLTDGMDVAHQADEALGKVGIVRQGPQRSAVAVDDDGFSFQNALEHLPGSLCAVYAKGHFALIVGVAWTHDGDGEAVFSVLMHQVFLTGDLIARVLPVRIAQRRALGDQVIGERLLISGCGRDKDILPGSAAEEAEIARGMLRRIADKIAYAVKFHALKGGCGSGFIVDIRDDGLDAGGQFFAAAAAVEQIEFPLRVLCQKAGDGHADGSGSADKQGFHAAVSSPE